MTSAQVVLDTDILSAIMRREPVAVARAQQYLAAHSQFRISIITRYEILRGLKSKDALVQLANFEILNKRSDSASSIHGMIMRIIILRFVSS